MSVGVTLISAALSYHLILRRPVFGADFSLCSGIHSTVKMKGTNMADIFELFKKISKDNNTAGKPDYILAGLGNPGEKYEYTRHNAGFMAIDSIAERIGVKITNSKFKSLTAVGKIGEKNVLLMKPQTFMNLSGEAVQAAAAFYKIPAENIIILSDDICQSPGFIRIRKSGSAGGHNGLSNIINILSTDEFKRIRIGVGEKPSRDYDLAAWVLGRMSEDDIREIMSRFDDIYDAISLIISDKSDEAMGKFNGRAKK